MTKLDKDRVISEFNKYVNKYDSTKLMIALKIAHTYKVAANCERIAKSLELSEEDVLFSWASGMLHDVGRFEQVKRYNTFSDYKSVDHAEFGADLLFGQDKLIRDYIDDTTNDDLTEVVIRQHNKFKVKEGLDEKTLMFCNILRDADKIDILRVNCETPLLELYNTSAENLYGCGVTKEIMDQVREHHAVDRSYSKTPVDHFICHLALTYELCFKESWVIVNEQGNLAKMFEFPTQNPATLEAIKEIKGGKFSE